MERKKLLLVAISVGIFLVLIISVSILIFTPKSESGTAFSSGRPISAGNGGTLSEGRTRPSVSVGASGPANAGSSQRAPGTGVPGTGVPGTGVPLANASQETNVYINSEAPDASYTVEKSTGDASARVTINIPKPGTTAVSDAPVSKPVKTTANAVPAKSAAVAATRPKPAAAAKPAQSRKSDYWVQTGAFSTLVRAEGVKEMLSSKGITSIIENRVVDGKTWYRVRVGPYTSETEANYWLALVRSIDGFADSQVRQSVAAR
jgi:DedD protein